MSGITAKLLKRNHQLLGSIAQGHASRPAAENSDHKLLRPNRAERFALDSIGKFDRHENFDDEQAWESITRSPQTEIHDAEIGRPGKFIQQKKLQIDRMQFKPDLHSEVSDASASHQIAVPNADLRSTIERHYIAKETDGHHRAQLVEDSQNSKKYRNGYSKLTAFSKTSSVEGAQRAVQAHRNEDVAAKSEIQYSSAGNTDLEKATEIYKPQLKQTGREGAQENQWYREDLAKLQNDVTGSLTSLKNTAITAHKQRLMPDTRLQATQMQARPQRAGVNIRIGLINVEVLEPNTPATTQSRPRARAKSGRSNKGIQRRPSSRSARSSYFGLGQL